MHLVAPVIEMTFFPEAQQAGGVVISGVVQFGLIPQA